MGIREGSEYSGHYGHAGRPGKRGGSLPKSSGRTAIKYRNWEHEHSLLAQRAAERLLTGAIRAAKADHDAGRTKPKMKRSDLDEDCSDEELAIEMYTGQYYMLINGYLRHPTQEEPQKIVQEQIAAIDTLMARPEAVVQEGFAVVRAYRKSGLFADKPVGTRFIDRGFVSTTVNLELCLLSFVDGKVVFDPERPPSRSHFVAILVPPGVRGVYIDEWSVHSIEDEFLLDRGQTFEVVQNDADGIVLRVVVE